MFSHVWLFATPWAVCSLCPWGFSRQGYWSGLPCPPPGDLPDPGIELGSPALHADSLPAELPGKACVCLCVKSLQSCPTLCNPMDYRWPGSPAHAILQARILEWVAISSSRGSSQPWDRTCISYISYIGRQALYHSCHIGSPRENPCFSLNKSISYLSLCLPLNSFCDETSSIRD